ncbi:hypothetical protein H8E77_28230 [bacterium]|nr:hypothetical protein [bacterium]
MTKIKVEEEVQHALAVYESEIEYLEEFDSDEIINLLTYRDFLQNAVTEHPYLMKPYIKKLHILDKKLIKSAEYIRSVLLPYLDGQSYPNDLSYLPGGCILYEE